MHGEQGRSVLLGWNGSGRAAPHAVPCRVEIPKSKPLELGVSLHHDLESKQTLIAGCSKYDLKWNPKVGLSEGRVELQLDFVKLEEAGHLNGLDLVGYTFSDVLEGER
jgi:hypothetical protein